MNAQLVFIDPAQNTLSFKEWQIREGEVLYNEGAPSLSNTDLLAHIIRDKSKAEKLMAIHGSLTVIAQLSIDELAATDGIGRATAELIVSATEFGKRSLLLDKPEVDINSPDSVYNYIAPSMSNLDQEHLKILCLNTKNQVTRVCTIFIGTVNASVVSPREIFRTALKHGAVSILLVHNHPSGDPNPSNEDRHTTDAIIAGGKMLGIAVRDHVIIGRDGFYSFKMQTHAFDEGGASA